MFGGGLLGFGLSRLQDLDYNGIFKEEFALVAGYWYHFHSGRERYGMIIHLAMILPAAILVVLQFVPRIRHAAILFHRLNGYLVILLSLISSFATCAVIPHKQGGGARISTQTAEGFLVVSTTVGFALAWWSIRRKHIDRHRAWMLRVWAIMGTIITSRLINLAAAPIVSRVGGWFGVWSCDELDFLYRHLGRPFPNELYPRCIDPSGAVILEVRVTVNAVHSLENPEQYAASNIQPFGAIVSLPKMMQRSVMLTIRSKLWLCIVCHIVVVELYLRLTPGEEQRLREVSRQRRVEAGLSA